MTLLRTISPLERRLLAGGFGIALLIVFGTAIRAVLDLGDQAAQQVIGDWTSSFIYVLVAIAVWMRAVRSPMQRRAWMMLALGITLYAAGNLVWAAWLEHERHPPIPSISDLLWLLLYPLFYVGIVGLAGLRRRSLPAGVWLDGVVAGLGIAALGAAAVFPQVLSGARGTATAVATELAYPIADLVLAALVVGVLALRGWRLDRMWALLGGGFLVLAVADCLYTVQVASGSAATSGLADLFYMVGVVQLALAAWQDDTPEQAPSLDRWSVLLVPTAFALAALALLAYGQVAHLHPLASTLAVATLFVALMRTGLTFRDVRTLAVTRRQARTDELTSVANRRQLLSSAESAVALAHRRQCGMALIMVDLDDFKEINDTLGHHAGDQLLSQIGPRLRTALRSADTIGRLGGDEFCVVLYPADEEAARRVATRMLSAIADPFTVENLQLTVRASIGIALFPNHATTATQLLQRADVAMYAAKRERSGVELFTAAGGQPSHERMTLAAELSDAISRDELEVLYQPQFTAGREALIGAEALVRWRHRSRGLLAPAEFIAVAEQGGLIRAVTSAVLSRALDELQRWTSTGLDLRLAVNVTASDLLDTSFPEQVQEMLMRRGLHATALTLEFGEDALAADPARIADGIARLSAIGVGCSLDGFGRGTSSLALLRAAPVGEVKLDRSLLGAVVEDPVDAAVAGALVLLAHRLGMRVVASGVETQAIAAAARSAGCDVLQGFLLGRPVGAGELQAFAAAEPLPKAS